MRTGTNKTRIITLLLLPALLLALASCGKGGAAADASSASGAQKTPEATEAPKETDKAEQAESEEAEAGETPTPTPAPEFSPEEKETGDPSILALARSWDQLDLEYEDENAVIFGNMALLFADDAHAALKEGLAREAESTRGFAQAFAEDYVQVVHDSTSGGSGSGFMIFSAGVGSCVQRADEHALGYIVGFQQTGLPSYGQQRLVGVNLDPASGEALALDDIVTDINGFAEVFKESLGDLFFDTELDAQLDALFADGDLTSDEAFSWVIGYQGISFYLNTAVNYMEIGDPGGYFAGFVPFSGNESLFDPRYLERPDSYFAEVMMNDAENGLFFQDVNADGVTEGIQVSTPQNVETGMYESIVIRTSLSGGGEINVEFPFAAPSYRAQCLFGQIDGRNMLFVQMLDEENRDYGAAYALDGEPQELGGFDGNLFLEELADGELPVEQVPTDPTVDELKAIYEHIFNAEEEADGTEDLQ